MDIRRATIEDLEHIVPLFDAYRLFYRQSSDIAGAREFLSDRITKKESIILLAFDNKMAVGFTQLYFLFSSVSMEPMYLLNDLYVSKPVRGKGVATALIDSVKDLCRREHKKGIVLQTETTNPAQKLYEHLGFIKDPDLHYFWPTQI